MARELDEETGLAIPLAQRLEFPKSPEGGDRVVIFTRHWHGDPATLNLTEGVTLEFHAPADLAGMLVPPWVTQAVQQLQATDR